MTDEAQVGTKRPERGSEDEGEAGLCEALAQETTSGNDRAVATVEEDEEESYGDLVKLETTRYAAGLPLAWMDFMRVSRRWLAGPLFPCLSAVTSKTG